MKTTSVEITKVENGYILEFDVPEGTEDCYVTKTFVFATHEEVLEKVKEVME